MSNGPKGITESCVWSPGIKEPSNGVWKGAGTIALFGLFASYLVGCRESWKEQGSWILLVLLVLYTLSLFLLISYLNSNPFGSENCKTFDGDSRTLGYFSRPPKYPSRLERVRSYLAFFPITHLIQNGQNNNENGASRSRNESESRFCESLSSDLEGEHHGEVGQGIGARINAQLDMAIDAIVAEYVSPWYTKISDDELFLNQCKNIIHSVFMHLAGKLRHVDRNELAKEAIQVIHVHWREYTDAVKSWEAGNGDDIQRAFKFAHSFLNDNKEVSKCYQQLITKIFEELKIPDLSSAVMCQFLAGILVKNFLLFYVEMISQPSWVNGTLITLLSSGSVSVDITGSNSQNSSSPASPLPEPSPKQIHSFGDEVINDSVGPSSPQLTGEESSFSPTKKSGCSGSMKSGSECLEDDSVKGEEDHHGVETISLQQDHILESISVDEGASSEPVTESSIDSAVGDSRQVSKKWSSSTSSTTSSLHRQSSEEHLIAPLTKRPSNLIHLKSSSSPVSSMRTVTTALGRVMKATAFPLLPSECYTIDHSSSNVSLVKKDEQDLIKEGSEAKTPSLFEECRDSDSKDDEEMLITADETIETLQPEMIKTVEEVSELKSEKGKAPQVNPIETVKGEEAELSSSSPPTATAVGNSKGVAGHYYSFDEASKPKPVTSSTFFETSTLSLDGAMDGRKEDKCKNQLQLCSHEYKTEVSGSGSNGCSNGKPHRSPVYEEPEDFAASIAKLRSLLEQKERKSSTPPMSAGLGEDGGDVFESPEDSPAATTSFGEGPCGILSGSSIPQISETCASDPHTTPSSTSSMDISKGSSRFSFNETIIIPSESDSTSLLDPIDKNYDPVPEIKCCFRNVSIPKVENSADAGGQYIYYCIQYEGVYVDEYDTIPQKLVYRTTTIKRKFKEFLTLQAHLEENSACKPHLKGIKTPTRWLNVSLTKSDATVAHQRRANLEKYLQQLCYHPIIGFCQELLIFMAYGEDGFCSFEVGDPKHLLSHRLDKLAKKFTGVINSLKDALPSFELDLSPAPNTPKSEGVTPSDFKQGSSFPSFPFQDKLSRLSHHHHHENGDQDDEEKASDGCWDEKFRENWPQDNMNPESAPKTGHAKNDRIEADDSTDFPHAFEGDNVGDGSVFTVYPLAAAVTHLLCDVLWLPQYRPHPTSVATFMSISGRSLEHYVMETMDIFCSEEAILGYLEWLTVSVKTGQYETDSQKGDVSSDLVSEADLKNIVKRRIPAWVRWMWGRNRLDLTIDRITGLFQSPLVNHDLVLSLSELLFSKMVNIVVDENDAE